MPKINLNDFALETTKLEGKLKEVDIAQIKEVQRLTFIQLAKLTLEEVDEILSRYRE